MDVNFYKVLAFKLLTSGKYTPYLWASREDKALKKDLDIIKRLVILLADEKAEWGTESPSHRASLLWYLEPFPIPREIQAMKADVGLNSIWKDLILAVKS